MKVKISRDLKVLGFKYTRIGLDYGFEIAVIVTGGTCIVIGKNAMGHVAGISANKVPETYDTIVEAYMNKDPDDIMQEINHTVDILERRPNYEQMMVSVKHMATLVGMLPN